MADASMSGDFIVGLKDNLTKEEVNGVLMCYKDDIEVKYVYDFGGFAAKITLAAVERLKKDSRVKYVEVDGKVYAFGTSSSAQ